MASAHPDDGACYNTVQALLNDRYGANFSTTRIFANNSFKDVRATGTSKAESRCVWHNHDAAMRTGTSKAESRCVCRNRDGAMRNTASRGQIKEFVGKRAYQYAMLQHLNPVSSDRHNIVLSEPPEQQILRYIPDMKPLGWYWGSNAQLPAMQQSNGGLRQRHPKYPCHLTSCRRPLITGLQSTTVRRIGPLAWFLN